MLYESQIDDVSPHTNFFSLMLENLLLYFKTPPDV